MSIKVSWLSTWDHPQFLLLRDIYWQQPWSHTVALARWWNDYVSHAPWVSRSVLCQREASSHCLVAEDALHCSDIRNSPQGASPSLWLTDQHGKLVLSHNSPDALCCLWFPLHGFLFIHTSQDAQSCVTYPAFRFSLGNSLFIVYFFFLILNTLETTNNHNSSICISWSEDEREKGSIQLPPDITQRTEDPVWPC